MIRSDSRRELGGEGAVRCSGGGGGDDEGGRRGRRAEQRAGKREAGQAEEAVHGRRWRWRWRWSG